MNDFETDKPIESIKPKRRDFYSHDKDSSTTEMMNIRPRNIMPASHKLSDDYIESRKPPQRNFNKSLFQGGLIEVMTPRYNDFLLDGSIGSISNVTSRLEKFFVQDHMIYIGSAEKDIRLTNFSIKPVQRVWHHRLNSEPIEFYVFDIIQSDLSKRKFTIRADDLSNFFKKLRQQHPLTMLYGDSPKAAVYFEEYVVELLTQLQENLPTINKFDFSGWYKFNNKMHYYSAIDENCTAKLSLANINNVDIKDAFNQGLSVLNIAPIEISLPIFLMMHSGYLYQIFKDAGVPIQFIFDIIGASGSRKTSLAKVLFTLFQRSSTPSNIVNFTSTDRAIELIAERNRDGMVVLDDLSNTTNKDNLKKFEHFLRQVCDQTGRKKSTDGGKNLESVNIQFGTVLTAESYFDSMDVSSKLRNIAVFLDKYSIDNEVLSMFQQKQRIAIHQGASNPLETYMTCIIRFVENHYDEIKERIANFQLKPCSGITQARLEESRRVFSIIGDLIIYIGTKLGAFSEEDAHERRIEWQVVIDNLIISNQLLCEETEPHILYMQAISQLMLKGELHLATTKEFYEKSPGDYHGFYDSTQAIKILPDEVFSLITNYYYKIGRPFNRSQSEVERRLIQEGICDGYQDKSRTNRRLYKKVRINGVQLNMLQINLLQLKLALEV